MKPWGAIALTVLAFGHPLAAQTARDSLLSRRLTLAALDQEAALKLDSALTLLRAARRADSTDIVAEYEYVALRQQRFELGALRDEYAAGAVRGGVRNTLCMAPWLADYAETQSRVREVTAGERAAGATACTTAQLGLMSLEPPLSTTVGLELARRGTRVFPTVPLMWANYATLEGRNAQIARSEAVWLEAERAVGHPLLRVRLAMQHVALRLQRGDTAGARALARAMRAAVLRDGRPGVVGEYLERIAEIRELWSEEGSESEIVGRLLALCSSTGDWAVAAQTLVDQGKMFIDAGEPLRAIPLLSRAVAIADRVGVPDLQLVARTLRGRAYTKAGRLSDAERDLQAAVVAGERSARVYYRADAYHNLAHLYESEGRWPEATRAVDRFVALAKQMLNTSEVASLLDAGEIRWKAGWHAAADVSFHEMVRVVDRTHDWYFAGEYFERSGDLARAQSYYVRGVTDFPSDPASLAGMMRVHDALGHADSAETWARRHDAKIVSWPPLEVPLLPVLLARHGRFAEATRIAHAWSDRQIRAGNVEGAVLATLQVAQLLLDAGHADSAFAEAARTDSLGNSFNLTREMIRARVIRGTALVRLGKSGAGIRELDSALTLARRHPSADILSEIHLALAEALSATSRADDALREYDLAALAVERSTSGISEDLDRAGYRERNLRPFDGATRLLLASTGRPGRIQELVRWSSRRNAAALALGASGAAGGAPRESPPPSLAELQRRLGHDEALLDYIVLDSTVTAIVITSSGAKLVQLTISSAALGLRIAEIRRPFVATYDGRLDLARARYAFGAAAGLYAALIQPFAEHLTGKKRLLITADGPLHALAFDALVVSQSGSADARIRYDSTTYLLDSFEVEYLPSPAFLRPHLERSRAQRLDADRLLAVAYGAPGGEAETRAIRDSWPRERLMMMEGGAATESAVKRQMANFGIVEFAVHAVADGRDPLASHLRLVADSLDDGYLHANEIAGAHIRADLVVLSACETNAGPIYSGEGVIGIARAFLASGAHAVVGTQWPIGAATAVLMKEFYARLAHGVAPSEALRAAKLLLRHSSGTAHPFYWAGFVLIG